MERQRSHISHATDIFERLQKNMFSRYVETDSWPDPLPLSEVDKATGKMQKFRSVTHLRKPLQRNSTSLFMAKSSTIASTH